MHEFHGPPTFPSYYKIKAQEEPVKKKKHTLKENIQNACKFISTESISNSDDFEITEFIEEKIHLKDYLYHLGPFHRWVQYFCTLTDTTLSMYHSHSSWQKGEESIKSCFIMTTVLDYPDFKENPWVFSLFSHDKEGKNIIETHTRCIFNRR
jgi:hypothetical protein